MKVNKFGTTINFKWWTDEKLGDKIGLDTETEKILKPGHIPKLVISAAYDGSGTAYLIKNDQLLNFLNIHEDCQLGFHNAAFDLKVITKHTGYDFHNKLMNELIKDTAILYRLLNLAIKGLEAFRYSLDHCTSEICNEVLPKDENIRLTFGQFLNDDGSVRYGDIGKDHLIYAGLDPVATYYIWEKMEAKFTEVPSSNYCAHYIHLLGDIALDRIRDVGIGVDLPYVNKLRSDWETKMKERAKIMACYGLVRGMKGFNSKYEEVMEFLELDQYLPRTGKSNKLSMSREHLEPYKDNQFVESLLEFLEVEKLNNFLNDLTEERVHPRYGSIKKTGRTSCSKPNIQNPPRLGGIREAFVPKKGNIFIDIDYSSIELYALAQILKNLYKHSVLFDKLQEGADVHVYAASKIFDKPEEEVQKNERQIAKICNYGLAANMSAQTFQKHMKTNGVDLTLAETKKIKETWANAFPEIKKYWKRGYGRNQFVSRTGFVRNNCNYTQYLNIQFQSLVAEGAKLVMYFVQQAGYNIVAFIHDELVIEHPKEDAEEAMIDIQRIMEEYMQKLIPGLKIKTEGIIRERHGK